MPGRVYWFCQGCRNSALPPRAAEKDDGSGPESNYGKRAAHRQQAFIIVINFTGSSIQTPSNNSETTTITQSSATYVGHSQQNKLLATVTRGLVRDLELGGYQIFHKMN
jgi:hypothetical protein